MAIQDTDLFLIERSGTCYKLAAGSLNSKLQSDDLALVNRSNSSYQLAGKNITERNFNDTDLFMVERAGASYKVSGEELKKLLIPPIPPFQSATWNFGGKVSSGSYFRMDIVFKGPLDFSQPTEVKLVLTSQGGNGIASLTSPTPLISGSDYGAENWTGTTNGGEQTLSPNFTNSAPWDNSRLRFQIFVPNFPKISGKDTAAKNTAINRGTWNGQVSIVQNGQLLGFPFNGFTTDDGFFN